MLTLFPLQFLSLFAYALLRLFVGGVLLYLGFTHLKARHELRHVLILSWWPFGLFNAVVLIITELLVGTLFILGAYTQIAALLTAILSLEMLVFSTHFKHPTVPQKMVFILLLGASLTLFITGAGVPAFDLPI